LNIFNYSDDTAQIRVEVDDAKLTVLEQSLRIQRLPVLNIFIKNQLFIE
jgi:hypothetical protein